MSNETDEGVRQSTINLWNELNSGRKFLKLPPGEAVSDSTEVLKF